MSDKSRARHNFLTKHQNMITECSQESFDRSSIIILDEYTPSMIPYDDFKQKSDSKLDSDRNSTNMSTINFSKKTANFKKVANTPQNHSSSYNHIYNYPIENTSKSNFSINKNSMY